MLNRPLNRQVLHLSILIVQCLDDAIDCSRGNVVIVLEEVFSRSREQLEQVVEGHETKVGIGIA